MILTATTTMALPHPCYLLIFPDSSPTNTLFITQMESFVLIELPSKPHLFELCEKKKVSTQPVPHFFLTHCKHSPNPSSASQRHFLAAIPAFLIRYPPQGPHSYPWLSFKRPPPPSRGLAGIPRSPCFLYTFLWAILSNYRASITASPNPRGCQNLNFHLHSPCQMLLCSHLTG